MDKTKFIQTTSRRNRMVEADENTAVGGSSLGGGPASIVKLPNGSQVPLRHEDVSSIVGTLGNMAMKCIEMAEIQLKGDQTVRVIHEEIKRIQAETEVKIKLLDAEKLNWETKFDRRRDLFLETVDKIEKAENLPDDIKKMLIEKMGFLLEDK